MAEEFWRALPEELGGQRYAGPHGLSLRLRENLAFVSYWASHCHVVGEGTNEREAVADWLREAEDEAEEMEQELETLQSVIDILKERAAQ